MVNNQLKKYKKEGYLARRKNTFEKNKWVFTRFIRLPRSRVDLAGQPGFCRFLLMPVFCFTRTSSTRSRVNSSGRSEFNNYACNT